MSIINIMALRHSAFYSPLLMTMAGGFLKEEGLDYDYVLASEKNSVPDNIAAGRCHLAQSAVATGFAALEQGIKNDIVHFAQINARDGFFIAAREPDAHFNWRKLVGKSVLVDHFFQPLAMFKYALFKQGIDLASIEFIDVGGVETIDKAFREGRGDYVHQQGPAPQQLQHDGVGHVVASVGEVIGPVAFSSLCASRQWCESDMASTFIRAYQKSLAYVIHSSAEDIAKQVIAAGFFPKSDPAVLMATIAAYQALGCWSLETKISEKSFQALQDVFLNQQIISQRYDYDTLITTMK
jgi:NitT/TauT family transport system substrate-binding protein